MKILPSLVQSAYVISVKWEKIFPKSGLEVWYELYRGIEYINFVAAFLVKVDAGSLAVSHLRRNLGLDKRLSIFFYEIYHYQDLKITNPCF